MQQLQEDGRFDFNAGFAAEVVRRRQVCAAATVVVVVTAARRPNTILIFGEEETSNRDDAGAAAALTCRAYLTISGGHPRKEERYAPEETFEPIMILFSGPRSGPWLEYHYRQARRASSLRSYVIHAGSGQSRYRIKPWSKQCKQRKQASSGPGPSPPGASDDAESGKECLHPSR